MFKYFNLSRGQRQNENISKKESEIEKCILERKKHLKKIEDVEEENKTYKLKILVYGKNIRFLQMDVNDIGRNFKDMVSGYNLIIKTAVNKVIEKANTLELEHTTRLNKIQEVVNKVCKLFLRNLLSWSYTDFSVCLSSLERWSKQFVVLRFCALVSNISVFK